MSKKPFGETKFAKFVKEKVAPVAGDVLGIVGDLTGIEAIEKVGDLINSRKEESAEMAALAYEFEKYKLEWQLEVQKLELEEFKTEIQDRDSARQMRNEFTKQGKIDWFMTILGSLIVVCFMFFVYCSVFMSVSPENKETFTSLKDFTRDAMMIMIGFYWGSAKGSRAKDELIKTLTK